MAEAILNNKDGGRFRAFSAGSQPSGQVRPEALHMLESAGVPTTGLRSKSWDEFARESAPKMDFIFTVCDNAAHESCPFWPGHPATAHWGIPDPAAVRGRPDEIMQAYSEAYTALNRRIGLFISLPLTTLDELSLKRELDRIGKS
jgi:arsenate reductase